MRYCTSQLLAGAILVEGRTAILLNTIEPYSRDSLLDAHHEKKLSGFTSSFPCLSGQYGYLFQGLFEEDQQDIGIIGNES